MWRAQDSELRMEQTRMRNLSEFVDDPDYWKWGPCLDVELNYPALEDARSARDGLLSDTSAVYVAPRGDNHRCALVLPEFNQPLCGLVYVCEGHKHLRIALYPRSVARALAEVGGDAYHWHRPDEPTIRLTGALVALLRRLWAMHPFKLGEIYDETMALAVPAAQSPPGIAVHREVAQAAGWKHSAGDRFALLDLP